MVNTLSVLTFGEVLWDLIYTLPDASAIARKLALHSASAIFGLRPHIL